MMDRLFIAVLSASLSAFGAFAWMSSTLDRADRTAKAYEKAWRDNEKIIRDLKWYLDACGCAERNTR